MEPFKPSSTYVIVTPWEHAPSHAYPQFSHFCPGGHALPWKFATRNTLAGTLSFRPDVTRSSLRPHWPSVPRGSAHRHSVHTSCPTACLSAPEYEWPLFLYSSFSISLTGLLHFNAFTAFVFSLLKGDGQSSVRPGTKAASETQCGTDGWIDEQNKNKSW